ncbi:DUF6427 family protein [Bacteroidota bacterium]
MLANILKSNQPFVIVFLVISGAMLWFFSLIEPVAIIIPSDAIKMPFYDIISSNVKYNSVLSLLVTFFLVLIQAFLLVQFNKKHILINYRTYLPAFFYILISSSFVQLQRLNPVIIGTIFIFIALNFLFITYRSEYTLNKIYLAGFFISLASFFWAPLASFILVIFISLLILRPFVGREWIVGILGFLTPVIFVFVYYFVFLEENKLIELLNSLIANLEIVKTFHSLHFSYYIFYSFLFTIIILASYTLVRNYQKKKIKTRKYFEIYWWIFLISLGLFLVFKNVSYDIIYLMSIPISFLLTDYFYSIKKTGYLNGVLLIFIGLLVYIQIIAHN